MGKIVENDPLLIGIARQILLMKLTVMLLKANHTLYVPTTSRAKVTNLLLMLGGRFLQFLSNDSLFLVSYIVKF